jgi:hypothetical protein
VLIERIGVEQRIGVELRFCLDKKTSVRPLSTRRIIHGPEAIEHLGISMLSRPEGHEDHLGSDELTFGARQVDPPLLVC